ncbi:MAG: SH3 domain-containing protein [bacterium]
MAEKLKYLFLIFVIILTLNCGISAIENDNPPEVFRTANNLYEKADFHGAIEKYQSLAEGGIRDKSIYYNLGNAYYKTNKIGLAVLNYKKAHKLSPRDKDITANLAFMRERVVDQIKYEKNLPQIIWENTISILTANEWVILCTILYLIFMSLLIICVLKKDISDEIKFYKNMTFIIFCFVLIFSISSYIAGRQMEAVITSDEVDVRNGPGENYSKGFILHEGTEVFVENDSGGWLEIILPNGLKGWIEKNNIQFTKD